MPDDLFFLLSCMRFGSTGWIIIKNIFKIFVFFPIRETLFIENSSRSKNKKIDCIISLCELYRNENRTNNLFHTDFFGEHFWHHKFGFATRHRIWFLCRCWPIPKAKTSKYVQPCGTAYKVVFFGICLLSRKKRTFCSSFAMWRLHRVYRRRGWRKIMPRRTSL